MIGLVLGETQLGYLIIKKLELLKKKFVIIVKLQIDFKPSREHTYKNS